MLLLGYGFVVQAFAPKLLAQGWAVRATARDPGALAAARAQGIEAFAYAAGAGLPQGALAGVDHLLSSIAPGTAGDPTIADLRASLAGDGARLAWIGYLSATSVYGDAKGGWVDETSEPNPSDARGRQRLLAERQWLALGGETGAAVQIFRLAGIYGPGRNALVQARAGQTQRIDKPGHLFSRIHVDDIAAVLLASIARPRAGAIYNVADDEPAASADVSAHAHRLLGLPVPPAIPYAEAEAKLSPMARSFYADNKRVANALIKSELGVSLRYPNYRAGLEAILKNTPS